MAIDAGTLEIKMLMGIARLQEDVTKATQIVGRGMGDISRAAEQAKSVLASLGVGLSVGYFVSLIKGSIDAMDHLGDLSKATNLTVETLAGLKVAAKQSGGDLDGIAASINKLSVNMGKDAEKFKALGVTAKDPLEAFKQLADIFVAIKDPQLRAAVGAEALGKAWASAAPLLAEGGKKIGELVEAGTKASGVTSDMAKEADEFNDKLVLLIGSGGLLTALVGPLLPLLNRLADDLLAAKDGSKGLGDSFSPLLEAGKAIVVLFGNVAFVLRTIGDEIGRTAAAFAAFASGDFKRAYGLMFGPDLKAQDEARRKAFDEWEAGIMAIGTAAKGATPKVAGMTAADIAAAAAAKAKAEAFLRGKEAIAAQSKELEEWLKRALAAIEADQKMKDELAALDKVRNDAILGASKVADQIEFETKALKMSNNEREIAIALRALETSGINKYDDAYAALAERLKAVIVEQQGVRAEIEASLLVQRNSTAAWEDFADRVIRGFGDMRSALKAFWQDLLAMMAKKWILQIVAAITGNGALSVAAGAVGQGTTAGAIYDYASGAWTAYQGGSTAYGALFGGSSAAGSMAGVSGGGSVGAGATAGGASGGMGAYAGVAMYGAIIAAAMAYANHLFQQGWRQDNQDTRQTLYGGGANAVSDRAFRALGFNDQWAAILSGSSVTARLFGHQARKGDAGGISGTVGGSDFSGQNWQDWTEKGGWFRSDNHGTDTAPFEEAQAGYFRDMMTNVTHTVGAFASSLGADAVTILAGYSHDFKLDFKDKTSEEINSMISGLFGTVLQEQVQQLFTGSGHDDLAAYVEQLGGTTDEITGQIYELLGAMTALGNANIKGLTPESLIAWMREGETLSQTMQRVFGALAEFDNAFMTDAQKIGQASKFVSDAFADLGITMPESSQAFYDLVHGLDLSTDSGRHMFEVLMAVAPAFQTVEHAAAQAVETFYSLAASMSGAMGQQISRMNFDAAIGKWKQVSGTPADFDVEAYLREIISNGTLAQHLAFIQSLGPEALPAFNAMLAAYQAWQQAMKDTSGTSLPGLTGGIGDLGDAAAAAAQRMADAKVGLGGYLDSLLLGDNSPLAPMAKLAAAQEQYEKMLALAQSGDLAGVQGLQGAHSAYIDIARQLFGSSSPFIEIFQKTFDEMAGVAGVADFNTRMLAISTTTNTLLESIASSSLRVERLLDLLVDVTAGSGDQVAGAVQGAAVERR